MRFLLIILICLVQNGCAIKRPVSENTHAPTKTLPKKAASKSRPVTLRGAVWELLSLDQVTLQFKNVDNGKNLTVIIEKGLTHKPVPPGHWELTGFEKAGDSYISMNTTKKFVFRMRPKTNVYAGSYLIGCPAISPKDYKNLKPMKFFNRYPFSSKKGLCEVVIGNDFNRVKSSFRKKNTSLILGF